MGKKGKGRKSWQTHLEKREIEENLPESEKEERRQRAAEIQRSKELKERKALLTKDLRRLLVYVVVIGAVVALLLALFSSANSRTQSYKSNGLDLIKSYEVDVVPHDDGTLDITYNLVWNVLDGDSEGPLTWVKLGLANKDCKLTGLGGAAENGRISGYYANISLDREYYTGETVSFSVKVHQSSMLCRDSANDPVVYYRFTPGWFNEIEVESYRFSWKDSGGILSDDSDSREDDRLVWEGSFDPGENREMTVNYNSDRFVGAKTVMYSPSKGGSSAPIADDEDLMLVIMVAGLIGLLLSIFFSLKDSYENGSGFRGKGASARSGGRYYHHSGGHRGCACAGCACACACAGGGRAGCSVKDYYDPERDG